MTLGGYVRLLLRRWRVVLACVVLLVGAAAGLTATMTPVYASTATSFVAITSGDGTDASVYQGSQFALQRVKSYTEVVRSDDVLQPVIASLDLPLSVAELQRKVSADNEVDTVLLTVTATDESPELAQDIAAAVNARLATVVERLETPRDGARSPVTVTTTVPASLPQSPVSPRIPLNLALGLLAGLALGTVLAVLREHHDTTITGQELEALTGRPPLALVGVIPHARTKPLVTLEHESRGLEEFRSMRAALQFVDVDEPPKIIVVTSALPGEGKTTVAVNLAIALAQSSAARVPRRRRHAPAPGRPPPRPRQHRRAVQRRGRAARDRGGDVGVEPRAARGAAGRHAAARPCDAARLPRDARAPRAAA